MLDADSIQAQLRKNLDWVAVLSEYIGYAKTQHRDSDTGILQSFQHSRTGTTHERALFHGHQRVVRGSDLQQQLCVQRFGPAHIDYRGIQVLCRLQSRVKHGAKSQDCHALALLADLALTKGQRGQA